MVYSMQHYVIKFVRDLRQVDGFSPSIPVSSTNKTDRHDITEILSKVALNTKLPIYMIVWYALQKIKDKQINKNVSNIVT